MTILEIILALWLLPAFIGFVIIGLYSKDWHPDRKDLILLIPIVNVIVLALLVIILIDDLVSRKI